MAMVGGFNPSEKYEFVTWDDYSQLNGKINNVPKHQPGRFPKSWDSPKSSSRHG